MQVAVEGSRVQLTVSPWKWIKSTSYIHRDESIDSVTSQNCSYEYSYEMHVACDTNLTSYTVFQ
jgi:hypothetical protein